MKILGEHDDRTIGQLQRCVDAEPGAQGVLCADGHLGYSMPIGGVVAYQQFISPSGVGYDIACGNLAVQTNLKAADLTAYDFGRIGDQIHKQVSFGMGHNAPDMVVVDHPVLAEIALGAIPQQRAMWQLARNQLGTVGGGNHYVDVLEDETGLLWIGVHFGSRGFGWKTANGFMNLAHDKPWDARGKEDMDAPPILLDIATPLGQDYLHAMEIAGQYAYAGRDRVVEIALGILGATVTDRVHNHHNFAWRETHAGQDYWVVRKGATPAGPGVRGFVGGSMGDISVILHGIDSPQAVETLRSTMHGAGRILSRRKAAGKVRWTEKWVCRNYRACDFKGARGGFRKDKDGPSPKCPNCGHKLDLRRLQEQKEAGLIDFVTVKQELTAKGLVLRGAAADETPACYRPLQGVLDAHAESIAIEHTLQPRIVVMAGEDIVDEFKD